jgi:hypothetical protein
MQFIVNLELRRNRINKLNFFTHTGLSIESTCGRVQLQISFLNSTTAYSAMLVTQEHNTEEYPILDENSDHLSVESYISNL